MKKTVPGTLLFLALVAAAPLSAGDWDSAYWGFSLGYGTGKGKVQVDPLPSAATFISLKPGSIDTDPKGALAGFQLGHNWQSGSQVFGYEVDLAWAGVKGDLTQSPIIQNDGTPFPGAGYLKAKSELNLFGSLRGRYGFLATPSVYLYATAGLGFGSIKDTAVVDFRPVGTVQYPASVSKTKTGLTAGLGGEWIISKGMTARVEALYADLGKESVTVDAQPALPPFQVKYTFETKETLIRLGMNFTF